MFRIAAGVMALSAVASAAPATRCIDANDNGGKVRLASDGTRATLCFPSGCVAYAPGAAPAPIAQPPLHRFVPETEVRPDHGRLSACSAAGCTPLGAKLVAEIARAAKEDDCVRCDPRPGPMMLTATTDRAVVVLANTRGEPAWNVADDKPIDFAARRRLGAARFGGVSVAGADLLVGWYVCPPGKSNSIGCDVDEKVVTTLSDAKGRDLGGTFDDFSTIHPVSGGRYVTTGGDAGAVQLIDHGKVASRVAFSTAYYQQHEQIDADHVAVVWGKDDTYHLALVTAGKTLTSVELARFPVCTP